MLVLPLVLVLTLLPLRPKDYRAALLARGDGSTYEQEVGQFYSGRLWGRREILPLEGYLRSCCGAAQALQEAAEEETGEEGRAQFAAYASLVEDTLLADGVTTVAQHLRAGGRGGGGEGGLRALRVQP